MDGDRHQRAILRKVEQLLLVGSPLWLASASGRDHLGVVHARVAAHVHFRYPGLVRDIDSRQLLTRGALAEGQRLAGSRDDMAIEQGRRPETTRQEHGPAGEAQPRGIEGLRHQQVLLQVEQEAWRGIRGSRGPVEQAHAAGRVDTTDVDPRLRAVAADHLVEEVLAVGQEVGPGAADDSWLSVTFRTFLRTFGAVYVTTFAGQTCPVDRMTKANGGPEHVRNWSRLFLSPGMGHCAGGPALDSFDALSAIVRWVEEGVAPESLAATGRAFPGRSRPLCAYPLHARYKGTGNPDDAANFECRP